MSTRSVVTLLSVSLLACSGTSVVDGAGGAGSGNATTTTGGGSAGGGASGGSGATGGNASTGGSGGQPDCPDIACTKACPSGTWLGLDGCPSCACAADLEMEIRGATRSPQLVNVNVEVTDFIGGINRWIFDFTWTFDDPMVSDDAEDVAVGIAIMRTDPDHEPDASNASWCHPEDAGMPLESRGASHTLYGFGVITSDLTLDDGFLSIRRNGSDFEGHAYFDLSVVGGGSTDTVHVAAPFSVPVP